MNKMYKLKPAIWLWVLLLAIIISMIPVIIIDRQIHPGSMQSNLQSQSDTQKNVKIGNKIGDMAPDFKLTTTDNREISLSDYRGKNVILNFWATWCGPCRLEMPYLQAIHESWARAEIIVLGVNTQDGFESAISYAKAYNLSFTIPVDIPGKVLDLYGVRGLPTTFFIASSGKITSIKIGPFMSKNEIETRMASFR